MASQTLDEGPSGGLAGWVTGAAAALDHRVPRAGHPARDEIWIATGRGNGVWAWGRALSRVPEAPCANRAGSTVDPI